METRKRKPIPNNFGAKEWKIRAQRLIDFYFKGGEEKPEKNILPSEEKKEVRYSEKSLRGRAQKALQKLQKSREFYLKGSDPKVKTAAEKSKE
ncbi:MAG: hypothetical protein HN981_03685 [Candidatus Pacebacteria bacterium]|jgi:hypothetical protein|nr:hypothetical protein [Candidatus Paceibacterota bacterium]MBT4652299.1 hypothetical protein [Candidatus Paceibacterota bacterium]MBT6756492.1 hypothetical protein [Candidatus Paceibacterota bacterium]MBT6921465.1 hypothetical protein [Candidatus Paceibacterota bacterium]